MVYIVARNKISDAIGSKNFHQSILFFVILMQMFGMMPVGNVTQHYKKLRFSWKSFKVFYTFLLLALISCAIIACFWTWSVNGYVFEELATFVFYNMAAINLILFLRLSIKWSHLMASWCQMDNIMGKSYGYPKHLDIRLKICTGVSLALAIIDFWLSLYNRYIELEIKGEFDYETFFKTWFPQLFYIVPVNVLTATYCLFFSFHATIIHAFNDLFIILLSITLALRFKQITEKLERNFCKFYDKTEYFWVEIREDFDRLSMLCKELDDHISYIILLSYSCNLFFLLVQLYQSLEGVTGVVGKVYFVYSFVHLIVRIVCVSLYGAWINDESMAPAKILNSVSSKCYNIEVRRLLMQISFDNVALTGCRMFRITRGLILSIAGAVVTYELVLIQFNSATNIWDE